jgi:hypothetical protein
MKTLFRSKYPILDEKGKTIEWRHATYKREQPKVNHQKAKAEQRRERHAFLTASSVPRSVNGQRFGLRKREAMLA